ncbi:MAG: hypothetical protein WCN98_18020, partial [Verrucomicrobiaceae bacterium]
MKTWAMLGIVGLLLASPALAADAEAQRKAELAERKKDMDADLAALKARLTRVPGNIADFRAKLTRIQAAKGINETGVLFGPPEIIQFVAENRKVDDKCTKALIQFSRQLKERGVDLIVVPYMGHMELYGYRLYEGGKASDELWPAKVEGLIDLLTNDVEVVELGDAFKAYKGKGALVGSYDHHFGNAGIEIIAKELGRRIRKRYAFAQTPEAAAGRKQFKEELVQVPTPNYMTVHNKLSGEEIKALNIPSAISVNQITYTGNVNMGRRIDPVFVIGDSSVPCGGAYPRGWGIMPNLSRELGWLVPYTSDNMGAHRQCAAYVRDHGTTVPQPRVLIVVMVGYSLQFSDSHWQGPWSIPALPALPAQVKAVETRDSKPFRASVKLTKVSGAPNPKETPYKDAYTVSEAKVTKLPPNLNGVKSGDTILLVEWAMKNRNVLLTASRLKVGDERTLTLTPWRKQINASEKDSRMIMD